MPVNVLKTTWLWLFLWTGLVISSILTRPPLPIDETRYLSVAWEMWQNHQFLVPHSNGLPYSHKPPLLFWLIQFSWWVFGVNEWSARLIAPLFGLASLFLTKRIAAILWPAFPDISRISPLILLSMGIWSIFCTLTMFDTMVVFFSLATYFLLLHQAQRPRLYYWPLIGLMVGLGVLAKGPVILVYTAPPIILAPLWITGTAPNWWRWYGGFLAAVLIGGLLALAWALPAAFSGGQEYSQAILFGQTAGRMSQSFAHQRPFYWYVLLLPLLLFPWSLWLPCWRGWKIQSDGPLRFCLSILVPAFLALCLISGKQIHYILPLLPICAILLSRIAVSSPPASRRDPLIFFIFFLILAAALSVLPILPIHGKDAVILHYLPAAVGVLPFLTGFVMVWLSFRSKTSHHPIIIASCVLLHFIFLQILLTNPVNKIFNPQGIMASLASAQKKGGNLAVYPSDLMDQFQFAARLEKPVTVLNTIPELQTWAKNNPDGSCLIFVDQQTLAIFAEGPKAVPYRDKWLLFRDTRQLAGSLPFKIWHQ